STASARPNPASLALLGTSARNRAPPDADERATTAHHGFHGSENRSPRSSSPRLPARAPRARTMLLVTAHQSASGASSFPRSCTKKDRLGSWRCGVMSGTEQIRTRALVALSSASVRMVSVFVRADAFDVAGLAFA